MLTFKPITLKDGPRLRRYYKNCDYGLCEYSFGTKVMWNDYLKSSWTEGAGCLIIRNCVEQVCSFDLPIPGPEGDVEGALRLVEDFCLEMGMPLRLNVVPESEIAWLIARYPYVHVTHCRQWQDYIYRREDLAYLAGRKYSGQRNHINKFRKNWPQAFFRPLTVADKPLIEEFWGEFELQFQKDSAMARNELKQAKRLLGQLHRPWFRVGGMLCDGKLIGLSLAEKCGKTLIIHIEKALYSYEGVYPALTSSFAAHFGADVRLLNREDDAGDPGLRRAKSQYHPEIMGEKYTLRVENELYRLAKVPELSTQRLTLNALTPDDREAYQSLCLDDERNRWWGYDYRKDLTGQLTEDFFLRVVEQDFANHRGVSFALRLEGKCIGEAVLYRFDGKGGAELGCRVAPAYAGLGYGREAFAAVANWAVYRLGLAHVTAKCYKENEASRKMLAACLWACGEDETFYYFDKRV